MEDCLHEKLCVAALVHVTGGYAIDATEVTQSQYRSWLAAGPATTGQPPDCAWNQTFTPASPWRPTTKAESPVVGVDWCDAYAYCRAVGKRLCGEISGGPVAGIDYADATKSQWYNACSSGGLHVYPYGDSYSAMACNGAEAGSLDPVRVGTMADCGSRSSGYSDVHDLSGNVWEWEDSCDDTYGTTGGCRIRGGGWGSDEQDLRCDGGGLVPRDGTSDDAGFRCCAP